MKTFLIFVIVGISFWTFAGEKSANPCNRLHEIKIIPFKGEKIEDEVYNELLSDPNQFLDCLIEAIGNTREMPDPRQAPKVPFVAVGDVAFWVLLDISGESLEKFLPSAVKAKFIDQGIFAYFDYVSDIKNREQLRRSVKASLAGRVFKPKLPKKKA